MQRGGEEDNATEQRRRKAGKGTHNQNGTFPEDGERKRVKVE